MKKHEIQFTIRFYEPELLEQIKNLYEAHKQEFRNKNEFLTNLIREGLKSIESPEAKCLQKFSTDSNCIDMLSKLYDVLDNVSKYIFTQFKALYINQNITERLLSSIYRQLQEMHADEVVVVQNAEKGFYDDLPERFENIIHNLKNTYGLK